MLKKYIPPPQQQQLGPLLDLTAIAAGKNSGGGGGGKGGRKNLISFRRRGDEEGLSVGVVLLSVFFGTLPYYFTLHCTSGETKPLKKYTKYKKVKEK